jgi:hypothetical protein
MVDELLRMPGRDMQMDSQTFFVSDVPQVQETI